jgi:hypothetical protein
MPERPSWATMDGDTPILDAEASRLAVNALWTPSGPAAARTGRRPNAETPLRVSASTPTPDTRIHIAPGQSVLAATRGHGEYITTLDTSRTIDVLTGHPADSANARVDLVVAQQADTFYGDPATGYVIRHVPGDPSQNPQDPHVDGSPDVELLARVRVPAGASAITGAMIENISPRWTVALGGLLPIADAAERAAITAPYDGQPIYRLDRDWVEIFDGTAWRVQGIAVCSSTSDRDNSITNPYNGMHAYTADTGILWQRHNGAWRVAVPRGVIGGQIITGLRNLGPAITTTTETMPLNMNSGPVTLLPNRRHVIYCRYKFQGTVSTDQWAMHLRVGTVAGVAGTQLRQQVQPTNNASLGYTYELVGEYESGTSAEVRVFSLTANRAAGTGNAQFLGGDTGTTNLVGVWVEEVGPLAPLTVIAS